MQHPKNFSRSQVIWMRRQLTAWLILLAGFSRSISVVDKLCSKTGYVSEGTPKNESFYERTVSLEDKGPRFSPINMEKDTIPANRSTGRREVMSIAT